MKSIYKFSILIIVSLIISSCKNNQEPLSDKIEGDAYIDEFTISGDFQEPEVVDLSTSEDLRALKLRPNDRKYPKIVLTDLENNTSTFEPYYSSVWIHNENSPRLNRRIYVEDRGGEHAHEGGLELGANASATSRANKSGATEKGVSRILKVGDKYKVFIRFSGTSVQGRPDGDSWVNTYNTNHRYRVQIALAPLTNGGAGTPNPSEHRIYVPVLFDSDATTIRPEQIKLPPLKLINGDYNIGNSSSELFIGTALNQAYDKPFRIPVISDYRTIATTLSQNKAVAKVTFRMRGALLSLNLQNKTGKDIIVKKLKTKSNNLAYVGFYDMWHENNGANYRNGATNFLRAGHEYDKMRNHIYSFDLQNENSTDNISISANSEANGRVYLWGAIDTDAGNVTPSTKVQFVYAYADAPNVDYVSETLELTPKTAPNKFEEGKVYLVNMPISKPIYSGEFSYNDFNKSQNDWQ